MSLKMKNMRSMVMFLVENCQFETENKATRKAKSINFHPAFTVKQSYTLF